MRSKNKTVTFETFVRKTKLKDRMAAGFWYRMFQLSRLNFSSWMKGVEINVPPLPLEKE